ncbi:serine protease [Streptomyces fulvoviolaceus]|uniref:serine protease n=1 Tax=Streptomyces fulvoviolaceus TaxID=285535 RepID=UPI0021C03A8D|nr:serine protease [Streptomyces fulvoviolaceus]MCT9083678.1 serine protease [Streptomyces fulvoviolaceus]
MSRGAYDEFWVRICQGGPPLGAGLLVTRSFVLTALHVLGDMASDDVRLDLYLPDGRRLPGRLCDKVEEADLALIAVLDAHTYDLPAAPHTNRPRPAVAWHGTYRPPDTKSSLSGEVTHAPITHPSDRHGTFTGLQLTVTQLLHEFAGYSGSPVHEGRYGADPSERPVVGILMEQELSRADGSHDTNVVYAASVLDAVERFPYFDVGHLSDVVAGKPMVPPRPPDEPRQAPEGADVKGYLKRIKQLLEDHLITPREAAKRRERAMRTLDEMLGGPSGD